MTLKEAAQIMQRFRAYEQVRNRDMYRGLAHIRIKGVVHTSPQAHKATSDQVLAYRAWRKAWSEEIDKHKLPRKLIQAARYKLRIGGA